MKWLIAILFMIFPASFMYAAGDPLCSISSISFDFYGDKFVVDSIDVQTVDIAEPLSQQHIADFYGSMSAGGYEPVVNALEAYRDNHHPDDWLFYQLIRRTAQCFSPKAVNYHRYTMYKWYLLQATGYDPDLNVADDKVLLYVQCDENIYDIPYHMRNGKQYICLNYHDYKAGELAGLAFEHVDFPLPGDRRKFSYKLTHMPTFEPADYEVKDLEFSYKNVDYKFRVKVNPEVKSIFANYPVADYGLYFSAPLSTETYSSLIPQLKQNIAGMSKLEGIDYLMRFTRYSFAYEPDTKNFGKEKRLLPEQTLLYDGSDCEDRAALFFCLVKEIYDMPMIILAYPEHVTVAIKLDKPIGTPIIYQGERYTLFEPTPQRHDLRIGKIPPELSAQTYQVAYAYSPEK